MIKAVILSRKGISMKKYLKFSLNEYLYRKLWKNSNQKIYKKLIYFLIPWILLLALYCILYAREALIINGAYGFLNDFSNLFALSYVFIFIYYVSGYYSEYTNNRPCIVYRYHKQCCLV